jgi:hypothetical protein
MRQAEQFRSSKPTLLMICSGLRDHVACPFGWRICTIVQLVFHCAYYFQAFAALYVLGLVTSWETGLGIQVVWARSFSRSPTHFKLLIHRGRGGCDLTYKSSEFCTLYIRGKIGTRTTSSVSNYRPFDFFVPKFDRKYFLSPGVPTLVNHIGSLERLYLSPAKRERERERERERGKAYLSSYPNFLGTFSCATAETSKGNSVFLVLFQTNKLIQPWVHICTQLWL